MTGADSEAFALKAACGLEGSLIDAPFVKRLSLDVEAIVGWSSGDDTVDGAVGETSMIVDGCEALRRSVLGVFDEASKGIDGANTIFTSNDSE
jgi:hypothetical protein